MRAILSWLFSGLLRKVLLAILLCSLVPLGVVAFVAVQGYTQMAQDAIPPSKTALDERSMNSLELWAYDTAQRVARFLYEREGDLRGLALLPREPNAYLAFYHAYRSSLWTTAGTSERPLYREIAFVDRSGQEVVKITDGVVAGPGELRDVSKPENTTFKRETYFSETMALNEGEVYVSRVLGWYVPLKEAYAAGENPNGRRYEGIMRFATPLFQDGSKIGLVVLSLDQAHVMEFTAHMISSDEHYLPEVNALTGEHSYIIDNEGWAIAHARHFYIAGFDQDGNLVTAISKDLFAEQQKSGYLPANLNAMGFIDANFPLICEYNRQGKSGSVPIYFWRDATFPQGRARALAFATIPYFTGRYNSPAGFGWVGVTSDADKFHEPADLVGGKIDQARRGLQTNTLLILALTVLAILGIAGLLARTITNPVRRLTSAAQAIESGERFEPERIASITGSGDELGHLARVFSRMALEVQAREERLKKQVEQLRIEIDEVKKARQVEEITETDYFRELRQHAAEMRKKAKGE